MANKVSIIIWHLLLTSVRVSSFQPKKSYTIFNVQTTTPLTKRFSNQMYHFSPAPFLPHNSTHVEHTRDNLSTSKTQNTKHTNDVIIAQHDAMHSFPQCERDPFSSRPFSSTIRPATFVDPHLRLVVFQCLLLPMWWSLMSLMAFAGYDGCPLRQPHFFHDLHHVLVL